MAHKHTPTCIWPYSWRGQIFYYAFQALQYVLRLWQMLIFTFVFLTQHFETVMFWLWFCRCRNHLSPTYTKHSHTCLKDNTYQMKLQRILESIILFFVSNYGAKTSWPRKFHTVERSLKMLWSWLSFTESRWSSQIRLVWVHCMTCMNLGHHN